MKRFVPLVSGGLLVVVASLGRGQERDVEQARDAPAAKAVEPARAPVFPPELAGRLGELIERDWKDRPEWADMATALLKGEPMRMGMGWWKPSAQRHGWEWLRQQCDADGDGIVEATELPAGLPDAGEAFARLDRDRDGRLSADDFDWSARSRYRRDGSLAGELFYRMDRDSNGRVTFEEIQDFFERGNRDGLGYLTPEDLRLALEDPPSPASKEPPAPPSPPDPIDDLRMLLNGEFGWLEPGPGLGDLAPDFTLPTHDGKQTVTLSALRGKPVVLVFGSFT